MPYHVAQSGKCPAAKPWAVVKDSDGQVMGCHPSKAAAGKQLAALYANEPGQTGSGTQNTQEAEMSASATTGEGANATLPPGEKRAERPPMEGLLRMHPFQVRAAGSERGDGLTMDGWAAVFKRFTKIDSWEGRFWEQVLPGAMRKTFREQTPRLQFDHGTHPMIGSIPIGVIESAAEEKDPVYAPDGGAHIIGRLFDNWLTLPVRDAMSTPGGISGMSFRFAVVREDWADHEGKAITSRDWLEEMLFRAWMEEWPDERLPRRSLREVRVPELGPVVYPAYEDTSVDLRSGRVTIDLTAVRSGSADERRKLASAVLLADSQNFPDPEQPGEGTFEVERSAAPGTTGDEPAGTHPVDAAPDAPEVTDQADNHPSLPNAETLAGRRAQRARVLTFVHSVTASHPVDDE